MTYSPITGGLGGTTTNSGDSGDTLTREEFFIQMMILLEGENYTSDPNYYTSGQATEGEWANIITTAFNRTAQGSAERAAIINLLDQAGFFLETDNLDWWMNGDVTDRDVQSLASAAEERLPTILEGVEAPNTPGETPEGPTPDTVIGTPEGIMGGGQFVRIDREGSPSVYAMVYVVDGIEHVYTFDSYDSAVAILGENPEGINGMDIMQWDTINDGDTWLLGSAEAFAGQTNQNYQTYFSDIMTEAALEAGVRDPNRLSRIYQDPAVQRIIAEGEAGGWSEARIQAEIRNTDIYYQVYPGIDKILASGSTDPEGEWRRYYTTVEGALEDLGYVRDQYGNYDALVGDMLTREIDEQDFLQFTPTFIRAEQSPQYAEALNQWTENDLGVTLDFDNWFDVLDGNATPELAQVVERATLQFVADTKGTTLSQDQIRRLAELTDYSEQQMAVAFTNAEEALLSVGDAYLSRYGLDERSLVNAAFGVDTDGTTAVEVTRQARKAATELGLQDDTQQGFFVGFDRFGRPNRQGLSASAPEAG